MVINFRVGPVQLGIVNIKVVLKVMEFGAFQRGERERTNEREQQRP